MSRVFSHLRYTLALLALVACPAAHGAASGLRPEVEAFAQDMSFKHGLDIGELRELLSRAQKRESILRVMSRPGTAVTWAQ